MRAFLVAFGLLVFAGVGAIVLARVTSRPIDGVSCDTGQGTGYHIHAFLTLVERGSVHHPPANVGIHLEHLCFYWIHTHDDSGIIHIEAPHRFRPTLGQFFAIWGQPLSRRNLAGIHVRPGLAVRVYLGRKLYKGTLRRIALDNHRSITLEIGPPFIPPVRGNFHGF